VCEGEIGTTFYIVYSGRLSAFKTSKSELGQDGTLLRQVLKEYGPGGSFGERAIITEEPRAATVIATENSWLITLEADVYHEIVEVSCR
jgi:cAMP-dependent protein kinase regulator